MNVLILGGTRFIGAGVVTAFARAECNVTVFNRGSTPPDPALGVRSVVGDRLKPGDVAALAEGNFDLVVDTSAYDAEMVRISAAAFRGRTARYLFLSTGAVYADGGTFPRAEDMPCGRNVTWGDYGVAKVEAEKILQREAAAGAFELTVLRPAYVIGPGDYTGRIDFIFERVRRNETVLLCDGGLTILQFVSAEDLCRIIFMHATGPSGVFNVGCYEAVTLRALVALCAVQVGVEAKTLAFPSSLLPTATPYDWRNGPFPFANEPFLLSTRRIARAWPKFTFQTVPQTLKAIFDAQFRGRPLGSFTRTPAEARVLNLLASR